MHLTNILEFLSQSQQIVLLDAMDNATTTSDVIFLYFSRNEEEEKTT